MLRLERASDACHLWQAMTSDDIAEADEIAAAIHTDLPERTEVFYEKIRLFPDGARKLVVEGQMQGYAIAHPWKLHAIPPLDTFLECIPHDADCLYAHDIAIRPKARGRKASAAYIQYLKGVARTRDLKSIACVSVYGTYTWWERLGFHIVNDNALHEKLSSYGDSARYMIAAV